MYTRHTASVPEIKHEHQPKQIEKKLVGSSYPDQFTRDQNTGIWYHIF